jgi:hypothetical protein
MGTPTLTFNENEISIKASYNVIKYYLKKCGGPGEIFQPKGDL